MPKNRLEAFSDGVIAILITIMVLELKVPHGTDWHALQPLLPVIVAYVLSFVYIAIYWNNHHHMLHTVDRVTGPILWANLHLLFWLSLLPFATGWMGENHFAAMPSAVYGVVLFMAALAYWLLQGRIVAAFETEDGTPFLLDGWQRLMDHTPDDFTGPVNIGNPVEMPIRHLAEKVLTMVNGKSKLVFQPLPADDPMQRCPDISLAREKLKWEPKVALDQGLAKTIAYFDGLLKSNKEISRVGR